MAEPIYDRAGLEHLGTTGSPIPGESLTSNPDEPNTWEKPPQFTSVGPALDTIFLEITEPEMYHSLMQLMRQGVPIGQLTDIIIYKGFTSGLWNPDLAVMLLEPVMYMLIALATHGGIKEPVIDDEEEPMEAGEQLSEIQKAIEIAKDRIVPTIKSTGVPAEIQQKVEALNIPPAEENQTKSLLSKEVV